MAMFARNRSIATATVNSESSSIPKKLNKAFALASGRSIRNMDEIRWIV